MEWLFLMMSVLAVVVSARWVAARKQAARDEIYAGLTPGLIPIGDGHTTRTKTLEYDGPVAVAFAPPKGVTPGLVGMVIDGMVDPHDVTATIVDLAARGHLVIEVVDGREKDWALRRGDAAPDGLFDYEARFLRSLFQFSDEVAMSHLVRERRDVFRQLATDIYAEALRRGWYSDDPETSGRKLGGLWLAGGVCGAVIMLAAAPGTVTLGAAALSIGAGAVALADPGARVPRTGLGTAVRIQALGFKQYLETAEANQIRFEEASEIFSRYLPYAMVFGVAERWAKVFKDVLANAEAEGVPMEWDLVWLVGLHSLVDLAGIVDMVGGLDGLVDGIDGLVDSLGDAVGDVVEGVFDAFDF